MMKSMMLVVATGLVAFGCDKKAEEGTVQRPVEGVGTAAPPPPPPEAPKPLTGTALADMYKTCIGHITANKLDEFMKQCIETSYVGHDFGDGTEYNAEKLVEQFKALKAAMPDWKLEPQLIAVSGRNILAINLTTGTHTGALKMPGMPEIPATNKKVGTLMFHRLAINEANKATEEWAYMDPMTFMGQLGIAPKGTPPARPAMDKGLDGAPIVVVTTDDAKEKANIETLKKAYEAFNAGKIAEVAAMMTADAVVSDQADAKDKTGAKEIETSLKQWSTAFAPAKVTAENTWAAGDYVVSTAKFSGTHSKDYGALKKTGKPVNLDFAEVHLVKDGKSSKVWRFRSAMQLASQLGLMPAAPAPGAGSAAAAPAAGSAAPATP